MVYHLGDIASGGDAASGVTVKITAKTPPSNINNVASLCSDTLARNLSNNTAYVTTQVAK